ncbi:MAG TPA: AEC family transporter [Chloroflexi bacterium]|nr:AEC family transporter [Chloroflexota bacterium]
MLGILVNILLPVFLVAGISAIATGKLSLDVKTFSRGAFYVFSPAMVIDALANSDITGYEYGQLALGLTLVVLTLWGLSEGVARILRLEKATHVSLILTTILANTGNYGLPVNLFAFGESGLVRAALVVTVSSMLRSSLGVYLAARGMSSGRRETFRKVLSVPVIYAAAVGLVFNLTGLTLPAPILKAAHILGQGLVPASLMVLGAQLATALRHRHHVSHWAPLIAVCLGRLIVAPLLAYAIGGFIGLNPLARRVLTLESATPSAVMSLVLATEFDTDIPFAALSILATTMASLVTVTLWLTFLMYGQ